MRKTLLATALLSALGAASAFAADAPDSPHTVSGNMSFASEYIYRGIAQTDGAPALQGGFDYSHASGVYVGVWGSNISWLADSVAGSGPSLELDVYGGYKFAVGPVALDLGVLTYNYPGTGRADGAGNPDTEEVYAAATVSYFTVKYSHTLGSLFGWVKADSEGTALDPEEKTKGSGYLELNAAFDLGNGYGLSAHVGDQSVKGRETAEYTDYNIALSKDLGYGVAKILYSDTDAKGDCNSVVPGQDYCVNGRDNGQDTFVLSFTKAF
jgi:uncharacterized protein (TIGR02001 family)